MQLRIFYPGLYTKMAGDIIYKVSSAVLTVFLLISSASAQKDPENGDVKLTGGSDNFQGFVQVYHNLSNVQEWRLVCPDGWNRQAADLVCKKLGLLGKAINATSSKPYESVDNPDNVMGVWCNSTDKETTFDNCSFMTKECTKDIGVKVECALPSYVGCFVDDPNNRALEGNVAEGLDDLSIDACMSKCREEGFAYAGLVAPTTCECGSAGEDLEKKAKLDDIECNGGCAGYALQSCGKENAAAAVYDVSVGNCGGRLNAKEGIVASPGFPEFYDIENPKVCQWVIDVSENGDTTLEFPMFDLDPGSDDTVQVFDGSDWITFTSSVTPYKIVTSAKTIRIKFTIATRIGNVNQSASKGFLASFSDTTSCDSIDIVNGTLALQEDMVYRVGDTANVICDEGYMPTREMLACGSNGMWYPVPKCKEGRSFMPSKAFTTTLLFMMVTFVGVLGVLILSVICAMLCFRSKKESEGYKGISSAESGYQKGPDDIGEPEENLDQKDVMHDDGMDLMHNNEQAIPLASAGDDCL